MGNQEKTGKRVQLGNLDGHALWPFTPQPECLHNTSGPGAKIYEPCLPASGFRGIILLGGSWVAIKGVISRLLWILTIVTLLIPPLITTHVPSSMQVYRDESGIIVVIVQTSILYSGYEMSRRPRTAMPGALSDSCTSPSPPA